MRSRCRPHAPREITGRSFAGDGTARRRAFLVSCRSIETQALKERVRFSSVEDGHSNKEHCYVEDFNYGGAACCGSHCSTRRFRSGQRGHRQYINRHRGPGRPRGTRNTKQRLDPATRGSDEHSHNRKQQSQPFPKEFDTANKCDTKERAGLSKIVAC